MRTIRLHKHVVFAVGLCLLGYSFLHYAISQTNPDFNVHLILDYSAAEQTISLLEDDYVNTRALAELRGNRIAASTTAMIGNHNAITGRLTSYLDSLRYHQIIRDDIYNLETAHKGVVAIKELLGEMKRRNFSKHVAATVEQIFPQDAKVTVTIPVYIITLGHENVDAYVRRIIWHGDTPQFVGENEGELTIIINLAHSADYGLNVEERFIALIGIVAHEVFHAAFSAYKENSATWKIFYKYHQRPFDVLLDLTQNEGIAYYLSLEQRGHGYLPRDWNTKVREAFTLFNKNAAELVSDTITSKRAAQLIREANLSGYWGNYGAVVGMFIAREIDSHLGRSALIGTISIDPYDFCLKYISLTENDNNLPKISNPVIQKISQKQ